MNNIKHIRNLIDRNLALGDYEYIISLMGKMINYYHWPKSILDESMSNNSFFWNEDDIISFTHQFINYLYNSTKLKHTYKIPDEYLEYYFKQIIVSYVADKIKEYQNKIRLSFDTVKRISKEILKRDYIPVKKHNKVYWSKSDRGNIIEDVNDLETKVELLPKIKLKESTKHFKPLVSMAINDVFELTETAIEENLLIKYIYSLFDQSSFIAKSLDEQETNAEIDDEEKESINNVILKINQEISSEDKLLFSEYLFSTDKLSLSDLAKKYQLPKSTLHHKITKFKNLIATHYIPPNKEAGIYFLTKLKDLLDE